MADSLWAWFSKAVSWVTRSRPGEPGTAEPARPAGNLEGNHATFCILPWKFLWLLPHGGPGVCCKYLDDLNDADGKPLLIYGHSVDEIWNSDAMRDLRRAMVEGKKISGCRLCYEEEAAQGSSLRTSWNHHWLNSSFNEEGLTVEQLKARVVANDYRAEPPAHLYLSVGNLCNLKCRMCDGFSSSRIERDPVHGLWANQPAEDPRYKVFSHRDHWFRQPLIVQHDLLRHPDKIRFLSFAGGETLLIKEIGPVLQYLIDAGAASKITLELTTSASYIRAPWLPLTKCFAGTRVVLSLDGFGKYHEYIRYPLRWDSVSANIQALRQALPHASFTVSITLQGYNVLNVVELFRFLDTIGLDFYINILDNPDYLRARALPVNVRRLAAARLRSYAAGDCRAEYREWVVALADGLEADPDGYDQGLLRHFLLFTNDLDVSRGQSFREVHGELAELLAAAGFEWTDETLYAGLSAGSSAPEELSPEVSVGKRLALPLVEGPVGFAAHPGVSSHSGTTTGAQDHA